jgi:uncharacterized membrane protein YccC
MGVQCMSTTSETRSVAGLPLSRWSFAARTYLAMMGALCAAFWLQLESPTSAMVCVAILALPTRGHAIDKAVCRYLATAIGVVVSIVIAGLFAEIRELFFLAFATWMGLCVYLASYFGGYRAYGAVLSGYTVGIVAVMQIDSPESVFLAGVNRGAAIAVGIAAVALVNDIFAAPNVYPDLAARIHLVHQKVRELVLLALREDRCDPDFIAATLGQVSALQADIMAVATETPAGRTQAAAARSAVAALCEEIAATRAFLQAPRINESAFSSTRASLVASLEAGMQNVGALHSECAEKPNLAADTLEEYVAGRHAAEVLEGERLVVSGLADMEAGRMPERIVQLPIHRVPQIAWRNAARAGLAVVAAATLFSLSGWPETALAVSFVAVMVGLGAITPNPRAFMRLAVPGVIVGAIAAGVMQFIVLDGADAYPVFMIAMVPPIFGICLLMTSANPSLKSFGALVLLFFAVLLSPSNPQDYNPESFLFNCALILAGVAVASVLIDMILPVSDEQKGTWLLRAAQSDLQQARANRHPKSEAERIFRASDRLAQLAGLQAKSEITARDGIVRMLFLFDLACAVARAHDLLNQLHGAADSGPAIHNARAGLSGLNSALLRQAAAEVATLETDDAPAQGAVVRATVAALAWTSMFIASDSKRMRAIAAC